MRVFRVLCELPAPLGSGGIEYYLQNRLKMIFFLRKTTEYSAELPAGSNKSRMDNVPLIDI